MAILSALLSFLANRLSSLLRAVLGWSVTALFGRLPDAKQTALAGMLIASLFWPILAVGAVIPSVAAWAFAFVPLQKYWGDAPIRVICIVLAVLVPPVVGLMTRHFARATKKRDRGVLRTALGGYPLTVGYALSCLLTAVIVPLVKLVSAARRWEDEHTFVQPLEGQYALALQELVHACRDARIDVQVQEVPPRLSLPIRVLKKLARGAVDPLVAEDPKMLKGQDGLEVYLYPADLLLRGKPDLVARVRACLTRTMLERHAYLVADEAAQAIEEDLRRMWDVLERHESPDEIGDLGRGRLAEIAHDLDTTNMPFAEWVILDRSLRQLATEIGGGTRLPLPESDTRAHDDTHRHRARWAGAHVH